ncbi:unnamed protein product [Rhizoctonia solani]|uniref:Uncharacterized protein n=1 Tax=Rhizoctonia solani TaxID=456999 RepID=A0A8H3GDA6_9AGAM|nr:unnamed protein product [Rhizoctonia solani]
MRHPSLLSLLNMFPARPFALVMSMGLAVLSFLIYAPGAKCNNGATSDTASNSGAVTKLHSIVNTCYYYNRPEFTEHPSYYSGHENLIVWGPCFAYSVLWTVFVIWFVLRRCQEQPPTESGVGSSRHLGRVSAKATGCEAKPMDDLSGPEVSPVSPTGTISTIQAGRGRQHALQDSNLPQLSIPASWDVKEPCPASDGRRIWMLPLTIGENDSIDQELNGRSSSDFPMVHYLVQAPRALRNRPLSDDTSGLKQTPYLCLTSANLHHQHRGSTNAVEACFSEKRLPLETSLYGDARFLQPVPIVWFILVVAVNGDCQDPEHDLEFWRKILNDPALDCESIHFITLLGEEATLESIEKCITQLFHDSKDLGIYDRTKLFVYLTGEGDSQNRMCLPNKQFLSKKDINWWVWELRATWRYTRPITLVLDICRRDSHEPGISLHRRMELISSCSAGQEAQAIRFESEQDVPYSCFFLAFLVAPFDCPASTVASFKTNIERRLDQLVELIQCKHSRNTPEANNERPGPQVPDWSQADCLWQNLLTLFELARMLSRTKLAREVYDFVIQYFPEGERRTQP